MDEAGAFQLYKHLFKRCIIPTKILPHLFAQESFFNVKRHCSELTFKELESPKEAAELLLRLIEENNDQDKFDRLKVALKKSGYEDLAENLEGIYEVEDISILKSWMEQHFETLETIKINETLLASLQRSGILISAQVIDIKKYQKTLGELRAFFYMFALVVQRKKGWSTIFLEALRKSGNQTQAYILETGDVSKVSSIHRETPPVQGSRASRESPSSSSAQRLPPVGAESVPRDPITESTEDTEVKQVMTSGSQFMRARDIAMDSDEENELLQDAIRKSMEYSVPQPADEVAETSIKRPKTSVSTTDAGTDDHTTPKSKMAEFSNSTPSESLSSRMSLGAVPKTSLPKLTKPSVQDNDSGQLSMDDMRRKRLERFDRAGLPASYQIEKNMDVDTSTYGVKENRRERASESRSDENATVMGTMDHTINSNLSRSFESSTDLLDSDAMFARTLQSEMDYESAMTIQSSDDNNEQTLRPDINDLGDYSTGMRAEDQTMRMNISEPGREEGVEKLVLRDYQKELAKPAKEGTNTVIVAPTGSGKTIVALDIAKDHLDSADIGEDPTIGFIVPTVALVDQQKEQFRKYIANKKIIGISGDSILTKRASLGMQLEECDIAVFTPQLLVDAMRKKEIISLRKFSLLIFDECHHSMKDHPYNVIMNIYFEEKKRNPKTLLPQIVGLTASVGVGKADSVEKTETHIYTLCASLDAEIHTVTEHVRELRRYVNNPNEETVEVRCRVYDPFKEEVTSMMEKIEKIIKKANGQITHEKSEDFQRGIKPPAKRDTELYTQWISTVDQLVTEIEDQHIQRIFQECITYLKVYNKALLVNVDCRTKDAYALITSEMDRVFFPPKNDVGDIDEKLRQMFQASKSQLEKHVKDEPHNFQNPKLTALKDILIREYNENADMRGIIFCKTRDLTEALQNWIREDPDMAELRPHKLVGTHTPETKGGMTLRKIENVLGFFKEGQHKVIVATTVAEEGLDISKCNLVIRYEHVTNETASIQAKGRGRAQDAKYILIGEMGRGSIEKERINKIRERMMGVALDNIIKLIKRNRAEYWKRIEQQQLKLAIDREMKNLGQSQKQIINKNNKREDFEMRCKKCNGFACMASDIRRIEGSHHVVIGKEFEDRVEVKLYPIPVTFKHFKQKGKLFCKLCGQDWGTQADYKNLYFYVLGVKGFMYVDSNRRKGKFNKWKDVPFQVPILSMEELRELYPAGGFSETELSILEIDR